MASAWDSTPGAASQQTPSVSAWDATGSAPQSPKAPAGVPMGWGTRFMQGLNDVAATGAQLATHALPDGVVKAVNDATSYVNNLPVIGPVTQALGMVPGTASSIDADINANEAQYQANRQASTPKKLSDLITGQQPKPGIDWARMGGNLVGTAPMAAALPAAGGIGGAAAQGALFGAVSNPIVNAPDGDFWTEKAKQAALGAALGGGVNAAVRGVAGVVAPRLSPEVQTLVDAGVNPTMGQALGGTANRVEQGLTSVPVLGDMIKNARLRATQSFNTAAINRSLAPLAQDPAAPKAAELLPVGASGRDAIAYATNKLGDAYDSVLGKIGAVHPDEQFISSLSDLSGLVNNLPGQQADQFGRILDNEILGRIDQHGVMTGEALKAAESNLGSIARGYAKSGDYDQMQLGTAVQQAQEELRSMLGRQSPENAQRLAQINQGYANLLRVQRASSSVGAEGGTFSPAQLQNAVKALDPSKNNRQFATGNALMQDLSDPAKAVLGSTVPDSGTPFRNGVSALALALGGHSMLPAPMAGAMLPAAGGLGVMALPYTAMGQRAMGSVLTGQRPELAKKLAMALRSAAPAAPLAAQLSAQAAQGSGN